MTRIIIERKDRIGRFLQVSAAFVGRNIADQGQAEMMVWSALC